MTKKLQDRLQKLTKRAEKLEISIYELFLEEVHRYTQDDLEELVYMYNQVFEAGDGLDIEHELIYSTCCEMLNEIETD